LAECAENADQSMVEVGEHAGIVPMIQCRDVKSGDPGGLA
jgi:hypothetical protein